MRKTTLRAAIAAAAVAIGIAGFTGVGGTTPRPTSPSQVKPPAPPRIKVPKSQSQPDENGVVRADFRQMGKDAGLTGDRLDQFVNRSEAARAAQDKQIKDQKDKGKDPMGQPDPAAPRP